MDLTFLLLGVGDVSTLLELLFDRADTLSWTFPSDYLFVVIALFVI